jgi:hypothetical protein
MVNLGGRAVFVNAQKGDVEAVTRKGEIVVIAAKVGDLLFGDEDQPHVGITFEPVEPVFATVVQRDDFAFQVALRVGFFFDFDNGGAALGGGLLIVRAGLDGLMNALRDVSISGQRNSAACVGA